MTATTAPGTNLTHRQIQIVFTGLMAGMLLASLDQTIVARKRLGSRASRARTRPFSLRNSSSAPDRRRFRLRSPS
jgi:hypothetical protein